MVRNNLKERLDDHIVLFDGAIGTEIYKHHFFVNVSFDGLCLSAPHVIAEIHKNYFEAGAEVMTTNTYGANFHGLTKFGLSDKLREINEAAVRLARENSDENTLIAGSVGHIEEKGYGLKLSDKQKISMLADQVDILYSAGADFIIFETLSSKHDVELACEAVKATLSKNIPYVISFALDRHLESAKGEPFELLVDVVKINNRDYPPVALGLNCGEGAEAILSAVEKLVKMTDMPVIVQPNAGVPKHIDGRMIYMTSPEYLATYALRYIQLGARGVGGCCGTGPEHIKELAAAIKPLASHSKKKVSIISERNDVRRVPPAKPREKSYFGKKLSKGQWVTSVEIVPPRGFDLSLTIEKSKLCKEAGVDAINIPDGPRASSRISPLVTALKIQELAGIEAILHFCCRDKNLIGMQADLLGCAAVGINNILFITGDPPKLGPYPFASAVFDVDSIGMVKIQSELNQGVDIGGQTISPPTKTLIGVGADPNALDMERELRRTREKIEAGAEFIITQPVFDHGPLLKFIENINTYNIPVIAGVWPLASLRNAEFMKNEVPGVVVPDEIMNRMSKYTDKESQKKEGIAIAREIIEKIKKSVAGLQVSAPFGNVKTAIEVLK